jgi:hypothetical protein
MDDFIRELAKKEAKEIHEAFLMDYNFGVFTVKQSMKYFSEIVLLSEGGNNELNFQKYIIEILARTSTKFKNDVINSIEPMCSNQGATQCAVNYNKER